MALPRLNLAVEIGIERHATGVLISPLPDVRMHRATGIRDRIYGQGDIQIYIPTREPHIQQFVIEIVVPRLTLGGQDTVGQLGDIRTVHDHIYLLIPDRPTDGDRAEVVDQEAGFLVEFLQPEDLTIPDIGNSSSQQMLVLDYIMQSFPGSSRHHTADYIFHDHEPGRIAGAVLRVDPDGVPIVDVVVDGVSVERRGYIAVHTVPHIWIGGAHVPVHQLNCSGIEIGFSAPVGSLHIEFLLVRFGGAHGIVGGLGPDRARSHRNPSSSQVSSDGNLGIRADKIDIPP